MYADECSIHVCEYLFACEGTRGRVPLGSPDRATATATAPSLVHLACRYGTGDILWKLQYLLRKKPPEWLHLSAWTCLCALHHGQGHAPYHSQEPGSGVSSTCQGGGCHLPGPGCHRDPKWDRVGLRRLQIWKSQECRGGERWLGWCWNQRPKQELSGASPRLRLTRGSSTSTL